MDHVGVEQKRQSGTNVLYPNDSVLDVHAIDIDMETRERVEATSHTFLEEGSSEPTLLARWHGYLERVQMMSPSGLLSWHCGVLRCPKPGGIMGLWSQYSKLAVPWL